MSLIRSVSKSTGLGFAVLLLSLAACGDNKGGSPTDTSGKSNGQYCQGSISQGTLNYTLNGNSMTVSGGGDTGTVNRISGDPSSVIGAWQLPVIDGTSSVMTVSPNSISVAFNCSNGKTVTVTAQAQVTATQIIIQESKSSQN